MINKNRINRSLSRSRQPTRFRKKPTLLLSEDSKITSIYLKIIVGFLRLTNVHIPPRRGEGKSLTKLSELIVEIHKKNGSKYERICLIIDRDTHPDFDKVQQELKRLKLKTYENVPVEIICIIAVPCFEYWLLLHCLETTKPFLSSLALKKELKKLLGNYEKNPEKIFSSIVTKDNLLKAMARSKKSMKDAKLNQNNPSTNFHELIEQLLADASI